MKVREVRVGWFGWIGWIESKLVNVTDNYDDKEKPDQPRLVKSWLVESTLDRLKSKVVSVSWIFETNTDEQSLAKQWKGS